MATKTLASITLTWDEFGCISHSLESNTPATEYQRADALALSVPLVTASQLGVLVTKRSIDLCEHALNFLAKPGHPPEVIQYPLGSARIDLLQKDSTIVSTFYPSFLEGGTMDPEEAVRRLLSNYFSHVNAAVIDELAGYMKAVVLAAVYFYLSTALPKAVQNRSFSIDEPSLDIQLMMLQFCETIYPQWRGGPSLPRKSVV